MPNPVFERVAKARFALSGYVADYVQGVCDQWLKPAPRANPGMLEMMRDRDRYPLRDMVPWAGEFAGKYLTGAVQTLRLSGDKELKTFVERFVKDLVATQAEDGYLAPWPKAFRLTNHVKYMDGRELGTWDTWGHYHAMLGLLLWHDETGDTKALACVRRIGDALCKKYLGHNHHLADTGSTEMNLAPIHSLCLLYKATGTQPYLDLARQIADVEFSLRAANGIPLAGDYINASLAGKEFYEMSKPRWESLHPIMGLAELFYLTGEPCYRKVFEHVWRSIRRLDRHNNGGFSSGEQAQGNPYHPGAIETCCTIAWMAMTVEMLRLTGDPTAADELELSLLNSVIGMHSATGRWATYNTPMDGVRRASAHEIVFQSREGTPELNCCSVNSARGFGMLSDWAVMLDTDGLVLNWYGAGAITVTLPFGDAVTLTQATDYPRDGRITLKVAPTKAAAFALKLRIPRWSARTKVTVNGVPAKDVQPESYLVLARTWRKGDRVEIKFDMGFHYWVGAKECAGKTSIYRGPILLAYDRRFNTMDPHAVPALSAGRLKGRLVDIKAWMPPLMVMEFKATGGQILRLCDFGSAGEGGTPYRSWLPVKAGGIKLPEYFATRPEEMGVSE